jgi:hypothetical protein
MNLVCQTMIMVCQTMIMACAELYAQWNNIVTQAAWRGAGILRARNEVVVHAFWRADIEHFVTK